MRSAAQTRGLAFGMKKGQLFHKLESTGLSVEEEGGEGAKYDSQVSRSGDGGCEGSFMGV